MAISHRLPSSSSAAAILVRHCPCCPLPSSASMSKIHTSAFYPLHPQVSSAKFICNLPVLTSSHPHIRILPLALHHSIFMCKSFMWYQDFLLPGIFAPWSESSQWEPSLPGKKFPGTFAPVHQELSFLVVSSLSDHGH